jgi:hypothetical protein
MSTIEARQKHREGRLPTSEVHPSYPRVVPRMLRYALIRPSGPMVRRVACTLGLVVGSVLVASSGAIHLQLWATGYRTIPTIGPLFLLQGIAGVLLAVLLLLWRRLVVVIAGVGFMVATIGGLLVSVNFGLFGFMDTLSAPYAGMSLLLEFGGVVVLGVVGTLLAIGCSRSDLPKGLPFSLDESVPSRPQRGRLCSCGSAEPRCDSHAKQLQVGPAR